MFVRAEKLISNIDVNTTRFLQVKFSTVIKLRLVFHYSTASAILYLKLLVNLIRNITPTGSTDYKYNATCTT